MFTSFRLSSDILVIWPYIGGKPRNFHTQLKLHLVLTLNSLLSQSLEKMKIGQRMSKFQGRM